MYTVCSMYKSCGMCTYTHVQYLILRSLAEHTASLQRHCKVQAVSPCQWTGGTFTAAYHQRQQGLSSHIYLTFLLSLYSGLDLNPLTIQWAWFVYIQYMYIITHHPTMRWKRCEGWHLVVLLTAARRRNSWHMRLRTYIPPKSLTGPGDLVILRLKLFGLLHKGMFPIYSRSQDLGHLQGWHLGSRSRMDAVDAVKHKVDNA